MAELNEVTSKQHVILSVQKFDLDLEIDKLNKSAPHLHV